jgi:hypothetical protein
VWLLLTSWSVVSWTRLNSAWLIESESLSLMLRTTVGLGIKHPSGAYDQIFITVRQLRVCWCGVPSLTRARVCRLQLLLALASAVIFESDSRGTCDHILLSHIWDFPFRRLLRLAGSRLRDSTPPPHGIVWLTQVKVTVTLRLTVSHSVSLGVELTRYLLLFDTYGLVIVGRPLWREDGSVFCQSHCLQ